MQKVFGNMEGGVGVDVDELSSDEDLFPADWDDLGVDKELASMAIDEINFLQINSSDFHVISALMNLSFATVLDK